MDRHEVKSSELETNPRVRSSSITQNTDSSDPKGPPFLCGGSMSPSR